MKKLAIILFLFVGLFYLGKNVIGPMMLNKNTATPLDEVYTKAARDAEDRYQIIKRNGSDKEAGRAAGTVARLYLNAKDESNYKKWRVIAEESGETFE